jgi:hypothetical protein
VITIWPASVGSSLHSFPGTGPPHSQARANPAVRVTLTGHQNSRLAAEGVIRPCDPAIVAARIRRADQRPQGWDLAMHLVCDDLGDDDIAMLEGQFPGLGDRITAASRAAGPRAHGTPFPRTCGRSARNNRRQPPEAPVS